MTCGAIPADEVLERMRSQPPYGRGAVLGRPVGLVVLELGRIRKALPDTTASTDIEPIEDPRSWEDQPAGVHRSSGECCAPPDGRAERPRHVVVELPLRPVSLPLDADPRLGAA
jgi:hypothetical protein